MLRTVVDHWSTGLGGLMRGLANLQGVTRNYLRYKMSM